MSKKLAAAACTLIVYSASSFSRSGRSTTLSSSGPWICEVRPRQRTKTDFGGVRHATTASPIERGVVAPAGWELMAEAS